MAFEHLAKLGVSGLEIAPGRIAPWDQQTDIVQRNFRRHVESFGLTVSSLQAIFFGVDNINLLEDTQSFKRMSEHMHKVGGLAQEIGASVAVFGAPRQRSKGTLTDDEAFRIGSERFAELAETARQYDMIIGLEPVPPYYNGDFLTTWQSVLQMVRFTRHDNLKVHLDTSCVMLGGGDIAEAVVTCAAELAHFHAAEPDLKDFQNPEADHKSAFKALQQIGYDKWVAVEMLDSKAAGTDPLGTAAKYVMNIYCPEI
ncbi:hypothetical protein BJF93_07945 [Xaviernesmea oryzae]|uniref:Xylose isomerase-like TIM barrel domain-containing protein n=1 Tax=Xaviernesmea oryzae TaxID=464029 RepID=A0A1Q9B1Z6_9HYPH|nr:sugar phosphate isomerase/epimerase [Xaviernesmea oryzae]OLP62039.1 hypothetical protein BJF93_07945 [Xaviernesmea oryzae]